MALLWVTWKVAEQPTTEKSFPHFGTSIWGEQKMPWSPINCFCSPPPALERLWSSVQSAHSQGGEHIPTAPDQAVEVQGGPCPCSQGGRRKKAEVQRAAPLLLHPQTRLSQQPPFPLPSPSVVTASLSSALRSLVKLVFTHRNSSGSSQRCSKALLQPTLTAFFTSCRALGAGGWFGILCPVTSQGITKTTDAICWPGWPGLQPWDDTSEPPAVFIYSSPPSKRVLAYVKAPCAGDEAFL